MQGEPYGYVDHCGPAILTLAILLGLGVVTFVFLSIHLESRTVVQQASFEIHPHADTCIRHAWSTSPVMLWCCRAMINF
jgi:hypothetical protein